MPTNVKYSRSSKVKVEMGAWMLEPGTWRLKPQPGNGILEPGSWKWGPGMRTPDRGYTRTPAAPGLARGTIGPNILIDVRRQGALIQLYA